MSTFNRKRQASPSGQGNQSKRTAPIGLDNACCKCFEHIDWEPFNIPSCAGCGHVVCWNCPIKTSSLGTFHPNTQGNVQEKHNELLSQSQSLRSRPSQEREMAPNVEDRQAQELQPQSTNGQKEVETGESSKRSLSMSKCDRCRVDKKKCLPEDRVWPTKCELCIKKDFPCSEGKRVVRSTKHAPAPIPSPTNVTSPATTSVSFEEYLKQWAFLSSYHSMMMTAKKQLKELERDIVCLSPPGKPRFRKADIIPYNSFVDFVDCRLGPVLYACSREIFTLYQSSQTLPGWFLIASLSRLESPTYLSFACPECNPEHSPSMTLKLESSQDACGKLLVAQHHIIYHERTENWKTQHVVLSHEVPKRASAICESLGWPRIAEVARNIGIYHPDQLAYGSDVMTDDINDCLGRSMLHIYLDSIGTDVFVTEFDFDGDTSKLKDRQDILGRTALVIACHLGWKEAVELLLEEQADPGLATMYRSLPLHHAAAKGSFSICEQLLAHKARFYMEAEDCAGNTALDWAKEKGHKDVVDLLSAKYAATAE